MRLLWLVLLLFVLSSSTCDTNNSAVPRTLLNMEVRHHERRLADVDVRVYLNHQERPNLDQIDDFDRNQLSNPSGLLTFQDLPLGNHWFIGLGYDPAIGEQVVGYFPIRFDRSRLQHDTILYVGEEDYFRID